MKRRRGMWHCSRERKIHSIAQLWVRSICSRPVSPLRPWPPAIVPVPPPCEEHHVTHAFPPRFVYRTCVPTCHSPSERIPFSLPSPRTVIAFVNFYGRFSL